MKNKRILVIIATIFLISLCIGTTFATNEGKNNSNTVNRSNNSSHSVNRLSNEAFNTSNFYIGIGLAVLIILFIVSMVLFKGK